MFSESPHRNLQAGLNLQTATVQSTELCTVASTVLPQGTVAPDIGYNYTTGNNPLTDIILQGLDTNRNVADLKGF